MSEATQPVVKTMGEGVPKRKMARCTMLHHGLGVLATLVSITIIIIVAVNLDKTTYVTDEVTGSVSDYQCLLSAGSQSMCNYAYVVVAFSIVATIFIHIMQCTTSKILRCGMVGRWADSLLAMVMCLWWSVACGVISVGVGNANGKDLPKNNWRTATLILFWIQFLVYLLIAVAGATRNGMKSMVTETA